MEIYEATPDGEPRGAVIVVQEAFGVNDHIQDVTRRFAAAGYHAVAPALFHRAGGGTAPYDDFTKVMPLFEGVTDDGILADVDATIAHLEDAGLRAASRSASSGSASAAGSRSSSPPAGSSAPRSGSTAAASRHAGGLPFPPLIGGVGRRCRRPGSGCSAISTRASRSRAWRTLRTRPGRRAGRRRHRPLPRRRARVPLRRPRELPRRIGRRRLAAHPRVVRHAPRLSDPASREPLPSLDPCGVARGCRRPRDS